MKTKGNKNIDRREFLKRLGAGAAVSGVKVPCRPMAAAMVMNRSRHTGLRLLKAST